MADTVRVLIVDDHPLVRRGTRQILETHSRLQVIGEAADGEEAVAATRQAQPDVVLMDLAMPRLDGAEATARIKHLLPDVAVIALTIHDDPAHVASAVAAGVSGYLLKDIPDGDLIDAVLAVAEGNAVFPPWVQQTVVSTASAAPAAPLSPRQREVLQLVAAGHTNLEIGDRLGLSERTVEVHLREVFKKLEVASRTEAVTRALRLGLMSLGDGT